MTVPHCQGRSDPVPDLNLVYEIVPDRFAIGGEGGPREFQPGIHRPDAVSRAWGDPVLPGVSPAAQFWRGDLEGVARKSDHLVSLGVDAVYLTPVHPSPSSHRYDGLDARGVDPLLGGPGAFDGMVRALHDKGIRVILDLVFNHVSERHPFFLEALRDPASPRRGFFTLREDGSYVCWRNHRSLPELDLGREAVLEELATGAGSVLRHWIERGVDGFRLDCANDLGVDVCREISRAAKACRPGTFLIGETAHYGVDWLQGLDGIQSYTLTHGILDLLQGRITARQFGLNLAKMNADAEGLGGLHRSWNMLSSHDVPRVRSCLEGDRVLLGLALLLQFTCPGTPMIYYGDEVGMAGGHDPHNRMPMDWDEARWDRDVLDLHRRMGALRRSRPEFLRGAFQDLSAWMDNGVAGFLRTDPADPRQFSVVLVNPSREGRGFRLYVPAGRMFADMGMRDLLSGRGLTTIAGCFDVELGPREGAWFVPEFQAGAYTFAKRP